MRVHFGSLSLDPPPPISVDEYVGMYEFITTTLSVDFSFFFLSRVYVSRRDWGCHIVGHFLLTTASKQGAFKAAREGERILEKVISGLVNFLNYEGSSSSQLYLAVCPAGVQL